MKKLLSILLALMMVAAMTACGSKPVSEDMTDFEAIVDAGKLKIGVTYYEPMNYFDENNNLVGFETEFATAVCTKLGVKPEFVEIEWNAKLMDIEAKSIDCIWNGMTITPEIAEALSVSDPYIRNFQVVVVRADQLDNYKSTADLIGKTVEAEAGSAGENAIAADENLKQANYISVVAQANALPEVLTGAADAAVLDYVLASAVVGKGDFKDLAILPDLQLSVEDYGIGCRKGSDLTEKINQAMAELIEDGTLGELAVKYGLEKQLLANQ